MERPDDNRKPEKAPPRTREIGNAGLFADEIVFSDTEKILFEEDLRELSASDREGLMDGNPARRYSAVRKLNEGGMKAIWEVDDHRTARKVAMALIQEGRIASREDIDAFLYEARLTSNLQHPNIIPIYDIALDENGNPYFTMKALKGETLSDILRRLREGDAEYRRRCTRTQLLSIFMGVCNAIDYAHTKGVIHLDLKPANVNVGSFGEVQVLDWGLSTLVTHLSELDDGAVSWHSLDEVSLEDGRSLTRYFEAATADRKKRNVVGGTPGYMAPEQAQGSLADIDFRTDVYTLGALLYEILTWHCPIEGATVREVLNKTVRGELTPPSKRAPDRRIPAALDAITMKAMATDPAGRYATVDALIQDLQQFQDGFATRAENPTFFTHLALLVKRHKMAVGLLSLSAAVVALILSVSFVRIRQSERVALHALATLQQKNDYIEATARQVAPDYLNLAARAETRYDFTAAEQALDTGLAFDPSLADGWLRKGRMLLAQRRFGEALAILSGAAGRPVTPDPTALRLARKYAVAAPLTDDDLPRLAADFQTYGLGDAVARLFYHLNKEPFDPATRLPAIRRSLAVLNPEAGSVNFNAQPLGDGWLIDIGSNPGLDDITPLCGLKIRILNASGTGVPDLNLLTEPGLMELRVGGSRLNHVPDIPQLADLQLLDISGTRIRSIPHILSFRKLRSLDLSGIDELTIPTQLVWSRTLQLLRVSRSFAADPTIQALQRRGVIVIFTD